MTPVQPILVTQLFAELHEELVLLLKSLDANAWNQPTVAGNWTVKDIVAHLLDTDIRRLSFQRDRLPFLPPEKPIEGYEDLVAFLNQLNAEWIKAAQRISPNLLISFLEVTGPQICQLFNELDPYAPAFFPVAWAGEETSLNWFDVAREYTEKWHHQQQIRDGVGAPDLMSRKWLFPVLDTFLRKLPYLYQNAEAEDATCITVEITGDAGGIWGLMREKGTWKLYQGSSPEVQAHIRIDQDSAWRLMTKGLPKDEIVKRVEIIGEHRLGEPMLRIIAVMA